MSDIDVKAVIKQRREELGLTLKDVAKAVHVSEGTVSRWESGDIQNMRRDKIAALARVLQVNPAVIMGWEDPKPITHEGERKIPIYSRVAAGTPIEMMDDMIGYTYFDDLHDADYFGIKVKGHSMEPDIHEGDVVIVRSQPDVESGQIAIVTINGDSATCKRLMKYKEGIALISTNPSYAPMYFTNEEIVSKPVKVIGRVVELKRKYT